MIRTFTTLLSGLGICMLMAQSALAACAVNATSKTHYTYLGSRAIMLTGGVGPDIIVTTYYPIARNARITVLLDQFCHGASGVLLVDGQSSAWWT